MKLLDKMIKFAKAADEYTDQKLCAFERYVGNGRTIDENLDTLYGEIRDKAIPKIKKTFKKGDK